MRYMNIAIFAKTKGKSTKWYFRHLSYVSEGFPTLEIASTEATKYRAENS